MIKPPLVLFVQDFLHANLLRHFVHSHEITKIGDQAMDRHVRDLGCRAENQLGLNFVPDQIENQDIRQANRMPEVTGCLRAAFGLSRIPKVVEHASTEQFPAPTGACVCVR